MTTTKTDSLNNEELIMSITLDKRMLVHAKVQMLAKRPESFKFRLGAIIATDKGIESFPYGKGHMFKELYK